MKTIMATDGRDIYTGNGTVALTLRNFLRLAQTGRHIRLWCAHGWDDIANIAVQVIHSLPYASTPRSMGWNACFGLRKNFYSFTVRLNGSVQCADMANVTRDSNIQSWRDSFGGDTDMETTWNICTELRRHELDGNTVGGMAMADYIDGDYRMFRERFPQLSDAKRIRGAYFGAYVGAETGEYGECMSWDVNSLYPYVLSRTPMPFGEPEWIENGDCENDTDIAVRTFSATIKGDGIPIMSQLRPLWGESSARADGTHGYVTLPMTGIDWELVTENYNVSLYETKGVWRFRRSRGYFREYVDRWYELKKHSNGEQRAMAKLMLNSLVGKFGAMTTRPLLTIKPINDGIDFTVMPRTGIQLSYVPVAICVNAMARRVLCDAIKTNRSRVIYADTDGIILNGVEPPNGIEVGGDIGEWKNDHTYSRLRILGIRKYCGIQNDGTEIMRLSGVHREKLIPFEKFRHGERFTNDYGGTFVL